MQKSSRYKEAFREGLNVMGLATAASLSAATLNPLPLLVGLVAEATYMIFVPDSKWYGARLSKRYDEEVRRRREQLKSEILPTLRHEKQERFARLEGMMLQIQSQLTENQPWFQQVLRKLDYLLEKFLLFASKETQFRDYLNEVSKEVLGQGRSVDKAPAGETAEVLDVRLRRRVRVNVPRQQADVRGQESESPGIPDTGIQRTVKGIQDEYDNEMAEIKKATEIEQDHNTKAVLEKRLDVLQRRHEFVGKIGRILVNLSHQLHLLEDTFGLISDEIRARSPEQILADIEDVVGQTDTMTQLLEEVAPYERAVAHVSAV